MANPVANGAPPVQRQPAAHVEEQIGNLNERELRILLDLCRNKDDEKGSAMGRILSVAALVAGVFAAIVIQGIAGLALGIAVYFVLGDLLSKTYHDLRNHAHLEAGQALYTRSFKEYIARHAVVPTIDNIVTIHNEYKKFAAAQAQQLQAAP